MASITATVTHPNSDSMRVTWAGVTENDTCVPFEGLSEYGDRSVQMSGTFGGATWTFKGSNEYDSLGNPNGAFVALRDAFGTAITMVSDDLKQITEYCHAIQPTRANGSGVSVNITVIARRQRRLV